MTNDELRRKIAERLGYRVRQQQEGIWFHKWYLSAPDGWNALGDPSGLGYFFDTPEQVWAWVADHKDAIPNWPEDIAAAINLLAEMIEGRLVAHRGWWSVEMIDVDGIELEFTNDNPARPICEAWLAWDEQKARGTG